jgi:hypothetical protein
LLVFLASIEHHGFKSSSGVLFGSLYGVSISNISCHSFTTTNVRQHEDVKTMFYVFNQQMRKLIPCIHTLWKYDQIEGFMQK